MVAVFFGNSCNLCFTLLERRFFVFFFSLVSNYTYREDGSLEEMMTSSKETRRASQGSLSGGGSGGLGFAYEGSSHQSLGQRPLVSLSCNTYAKRLQTHLDFFSECKNQTENGKESEALHWL